MSALYHRERQGKGQFIDVAMLDSIMPLMGWVAANLLIAGQQPMLMGNDNFTAAPSGTFKTADGYINIAANKQEQWESLCDVLGVAELKRDERFEKRDTRKKNRKLLTPLLEAKLTTRSTAEWVDLLNAKDVPSGAILGLEAALNQPQVRHRAILKDIKTEGIGTLKLFGLAPQFSDTPGELNAPPPRLSAHTEEVLAGLGIKKEEAAALKAKKII
jgi:crotonobetainyl-CoA:carnitine CoA-transferase CaiB-like acyl-CoA transferase